MLRRMLPGLNSAAVGLIVASVFSLTFQIYHASPFPMTTICIGARTSFLILPPMQSVFCTSYLVLKVTYWGLAHLKPQG